MFDLEKFKNGAVAKTLDGRDAYFIGYEPSFRSNIQVIYRIEGVDNAFACSVTGSRFNGNDEFSLIDMKKHQVTRYLNFYASDRVYSHKTEQSAISASKQAVSETCIACAVPVTFEIND